jgi:MATE family multidrug resistance protein
VAERDNLSPRPLRAEVLVLLTAAWPVIVGQVGSMMLNTVDTVMMGQVSHEALAAVTLANVWSFAWLVLGIGTAAGLDPALAQAWGARDDEGYDRAVVRGLAVLMLLSIPLTLAHLLTGPALRLAGQPPEVLELAHSYALAVGPSTPMFLGWFLFKQALQGRNLAKPVMWAALLGNVVNIAGNQLLMFGVGSWEGLGPVGSGVSTAIVRLAMLVALVAFADRERLALRRSWRAALDLPGLRRVAATALPVGVQVGTEGWAFNMATLVTGWFGAATAAAHAIGMTISALSFMFALGLSAAAAARVGNLLGAGEDWTRAGRVSLGLGWAWGAMAGLLLVSFPTVIVRPFVQDEATRALAASLLPFAGAFQVFDATQVVAFGVLRGAGDTRVPTLANMVGYWLIGLPLGAALATWGGWGVHGLWLGLVVGLATVSTLLHVRVGQVAGQGGVRVIA